MGLKMTPSVGEQTRVKTILDQPEYEKFCRTEIEIRPKFEI